MKIITALRLSGVLGLEDKLNDEIYDPDCSSCDQAQKDYADLERITDDLAMLVRRLAQSLSKVAPDNELPAKALDYLKRKGLLGSPLRGVPNAN